MVKRNTEPISQTCLRCGGLHFGSYRCPYLDVAVCFACLKTIAAESGSDPHVHPNRKYDAIGRVYHAGCPLSEIDYSCSVDASGARAPTVRGLENNRLHQGLFYIDSWELENQEAYIKAVENKDHAAMAAATAAQIDWFIEQYKDKEL